MGQRKGSLYCTNITQYGSTVYIGIYKDFVHFHFQFEVDFTLMIYQGEECVKNNQYTKIGCVVMHAIYAC